MIKRIFSNCSKVFITLIILIAALMLVACIDNLDNMDDYEFTLSTYEATLMVGDTLDVTAELKKGDVVIDEVITWISTSPLVASVEGGTIYALAVGTTTIKAQYKTIEVKLELTVVAVEDSQHTVTFHSNGGTSIDAQVLTDGETLASPTAPTKIGHTFDGWYIDETLNTPFDFDTPVTSGFTLYAGWIIHQYIVSFVTNNAVEKADIKINHGASLSASDLAIERDTHALEGWYVDENLTTLFEKTTSITSDLILYAKWEIKNLTISFNTNDELINKANITMNYGAIMSTAQLNIGSKAHHDFGGWFKDSDFTLPFVRTEPLIESLTLHAKWMEHDKTTYTIKHLIKTSSTTTELHSETTIEDIYVGSTVIVNAIDIANLIPDHASLEVTILADGQTVVEMLYGPVGFTYELEFNGGNTRYATRIDMVNDWLNDYNQFAGTNYTIETLPMDAWVMANIHSFMYSPVYRSKWIWVAEYLSVVGSSTNKGPVGLLITLPTLQQFDVNSDNNKYAVSYEFRGFMKGEKFTSNASWQSSDYALNELQNGFWPYLSNKEQVIFPNTQFEAYLPTNVYYPNHDFVGWYETSDFSGGMITVITEPTKLYAKYEEKTPVEELIINNIIEEMEKGTEHQLDVTILPLDAYNKTLIYESSDVRIATVSLDGVIYALNEGEVTITAKSQNGLVSTTFDLSIYPRDDIMLSFSEAFNGYVKVNDQFTVEAIGVGRQATSENYSYVVDNPVILYMSEPGVFNALEVGTTQILIFNLDTLVFTYTVVVQATFTESRIDQLLAILAGGHNSVATGLNVIPYYTANEEWSDPRHESVNLFLFDDFVVDRSTYRVQDGLKDSGERPSTEFILVHDTANLNGGLAAHGNFFANIANLVSIHYITGDYGIVQSLSNNRIGWHGGDSNLQFEWLPTGIEVTSEEAPFIDISVDGYFTFNGIKSTVMAPKHTNGSILDRSYFTFLGPNWEVFDDEYFIGTTHFTTSQQSRGVIASRGGNRHSVGIEMAVNRDGDIIDTVQRTAKLIANLLEQYNLDNRRVILHNSTDGKGDPYTLNNTIYKGTWYFDRFMEHVAIEREILVNFSDAIITLTSDSPLVSSTGRILELPEFTTEVMYTITVEIEGVTKSINLVTVVPGIQTWSQNFGFFKPIQPYAKSDHGI